MGKWTSNSSVGFLKFLTTALTRPKFKKSSSTLIKTIQQLFSSMNFGLCTNNTRIAQKLKANEEPKKYENLWFIPNTYQNLTKETQRKKSSFIVVNGLARLNNRPINYKTNWWTRQFIVLKLSWEWLESSLDLNDFPGLEFFLQIEQVLLFGEFVPEDLWYFGPFVDRVKCRIRFSDQIESLILVIVFDDHALGYLASESDHFSCWGSLHLDTGGAHSKTGGICNYYRGFDKLSQLVKSYLVSYKFNSTSNQTFPFICQYLNFYSNTLYKATPKLNANIEHIFLILHNFILGLCSKFNTITHKVRWCLCPR